MQGQTRRGVAARRPAPSTTAVARRGETSVAAYRDPQRITQALAAAAEHAHLVSPATVCGNLPAGCEVVLSQVLVDSRELRDGGDCYSLAGKLGLGKTALDKIAGAAGVSWDMGLSGRLDDGSDPHYCHFRAVGHVRDLDGSERTISGEVEMDAREGSPQLEEIIEKAKRNNRPPENQIRELRKFLIRHAESKAKNRAIRSLGVKTAYTKEDLQKPFTVAKLMWTGRTGDPGLDRELALVTADRMLGARTSLYGATTAREVPRPALTSGSHGHAPPPLGDVYDTDAIDDDEPANDFHGAGDHDPEPADHEPRAAAGGNGNGGDGNGTEREGIDTSQYVIPAGHAKGTPLPEAEEKDVRYWHDRMAKEIESGEVPEKFRRSTEERFAAFQAELAYREQEGGY